MLKMFDNLNENSNNNNNNNNNNSNNNSNSNLNRNANLINFKREINNNSSENMLINEQSISQQKNLNLPVLPMSLSGVSAVPLTNISSTNLLNESSRLNNTSSYQDLTEKYNNKSSNNESTYDLNQLKYKNKYNNNANIINNNNNGSGSASSLTNGLSNIPIIKNPYVSTLNSKNDINSLSRNMNFNLNEEIFELQASTNNSNKTRLQLSNSSLTNLVIPLHNNNSSLNNLNNLDSSMSNDNKKLRGLNLYKNNSSKENLNLISNLNKSASQTKMATLPAAPIILNTKNLLMDKPPLPSSNLSSANQQQQPSHQAQQPPPTTIRSKSSTPVNMLTHQNSNTVPLLDKNNNNNNNNNHLEASRIDIINSFNRQNSSSTNFTSSTLTLNASTYSNKNKQPPSNINDSLATLNLYQNSSYNLVNEDFEFDETTLLTLKRENSSLQSSSNSSINNTKNNIIKEKEELSKEEKDKRLKQLDLISTIGTGTFGRVTLVKNQVTKEHFALKMMSIHDVIRLKQIEHVKNEKNILELVANHPFLVKIIWTHHDSQYLYMLLEYVPGGELFSLLRQRNKFETKAAIFYSAEIVCALEYLHSMQIAYRDLKPENILLDLEGHLKLTDFGFAKVVTNKTYTLCGTPEYLAPEVILNRGHDMCCDWWTLGIIIFEFLSGSPPFYDENQYKVYEKILAGNSKIDWPRHFDSAAKDIIKKLLVADPTKRLGSGNCGIVQAPLLNHTNSLSDSNEPKGSIFLTENDNQSINESNSTATSVINSAKTTRNPGDMTPLALLRKKMLIPSIVNHMKKTKSTLGSEEVKKHRWFVSITNWSDVVERRLKPPFKPEVLFDGDTRNFEKYDTPDLYKVPCANDKQLDLFVNF